MHVEKIRYKDIESFEAFARMKKKSFGESFTASTPAPFIGHYGYPNVSIGLLSPAEVRDDAWIFDAPKFWIEKSYKIPEIVNLRTELVNSRAKAHVKDMAKISEIAQEVGMASKPVDVEYSLIKRPVVSVNFDDFVAPMGPFAELKQVQITSNPSVHTKVEKVVSDTGLKANEAILYLSRHDFDELFISKLLSVGTIGLKQNRKFVPTRWSITAVDDMLGKNLLSLIREFEKISDLLFFRGGHLGNYYFVLLFPGDWGYELFEIYRPSPDSPIKYSTDHEFFEGRKSYAENCAGGYYSVRLAVAEKLCQLKRQARALIIRIITNEYTVPLGVWVTREASRNAMKDKPLSFASKDLLFSYTAQFIKNKFGFDICPFFNQSKILHEPRQLNLNLF